MAVSIFDLFKIGIGPSSSHTVGPMKAACMFARRLEEQDLLSDVFRVEVSLFGSLAHTGRGHGTDKAVMLGLQGELPDSVDPERIDSMLARIETNRSISLLGRHEIPFVLKKDLLFRKRELLPYHPNGMRFNAFDRQENMLKSSEYYSVGGGFVVNRDEAAEDRIVADETRLPFPFDSADELLALCRENGMVIADVMLANERTWRSRQAIRDGLLHIHAAMNSCMERGFRQKGTLPGGLNVTRRAPVLHRELSEQLPGEDSLSTLDWVNLYALAVNEENAAGGRVVTAPTNGAAGIIPAVIRYYCDFIPGANEDGVIEFLLTAGAIGILYMKNASISGAEVGCQGEVGVACSMAAGGLTAAMGGAVFQVENAAEIGMEHNLGLTCDPVGGLVQIPCIERNAMAAVKAINAQRMAARGDGKHRVSLDKVIKTMRDTGADMKSHYKETSRGGLAVNVIEC
ncbi:MAG: L-serine ammonia-lyase [Xanthomonadales bacterium]|jgi:L-serine dehydratase|nr:L-serine ammonia-lyase [Xanthomonadales bacterium]MDH3940712.1 L-serine ammonia-lyase [Xanthomonadales bacterium]MDH4001280.1 L-serine ammonia-lyase [Xanthomonadales bacterium]